MSLSLSIQASNNATFGVGANGRVDMQVRRQFFDRLIELSQASEDDPAAQTALDQIEAALSGDVEERSFGYIKLNIL